MAIGEAAGFMLVPEACMGSAGVDMGMFIWDMSIWDISCCARRDVAANNIAKKIRTSVLLKKSVGQAVPPVGIKK
jgi:hypothetical protein